MFLAGRVWSRGSGLTQFQTSFAGLSEQPISDHGNWYANGTSWTPISVSGGLAIGTQDGSGGFDDSAQYLHIPFPQRQKAQGTIHMSAGITSTFQEVEIHLRGWTDGNLVSRGYECNLAYDGAYTDIVRWNGPLGGFNILSHVTTSVPVPSDGGVLSAQIDASGNIAVFYNGSQINSFADTMWTDGNPGMGFFLQGATSNLPKFGFSSFYASSW